MILDGLELSPQPTARFTATRYIAVDLLDAEFAALLARPLPHIATVYVDPAEWSFRTFENIVPLDRWFRDPITTAFSDYLEHEVDVFQFKLDCNAPLAKLDDLPLYATPLNANTRGGQRYIFHAAALADALTAGLRDALPEIWRKGLVGVNPVFRCNRFEPGDAPFAPHVDTPYFDAGKQHVSRFSLLIYLTGGIGSPALKIEPFEIAAIEPMTCVIFSQERFHEGNPFHDGRKVFLRTELVYTERNYKREPRIAQLFSKACYLTGESIRAPALASDADVAYNRVAAAHWTGVVDMPRAEPFVHKRFRGVDWLANGYDFWFPKSVPLFECAALTLLDYFNCKIGETPFKSLCTSEVVRDVDVETYLPDATQAIPALDTSPLFPRPELPDTCCPAHAPTIFDPTLSHDVIDLYRVGQEFARRRIENAPIFMMGEQVFLHPSRFVIDGDKIHVLSQHTLTPVNFAACWNCRSEPPNYVDVDAFVDVVQPLVPPILWEATPRTHHLMFDFFRNSWMVDHKTNRVPVPRIRIAHHETVEGEPWLDAAERAQPIPKPIHDRPPWWAHYSRTRPLMLELFGRYKR